MDKSDKNSPDSARIRELEEIVRQKDRDMSDYREEVTRLNHRLEGLIIQIGQQLNMAHSIQRALVPTEIPTIPGFEFSTKFVASMITGGDYFDIFELEDRFRFALLISHSSGHGMSGLLLSVILKLMSQAEARRGAAPEEVVKQMARELIPVIPGKESASIFYAVVDRRNMELRFTIAGPLVAFLYKAADQQFKLLMSSGSSLSKSFDEKISSLSQGLNARDRLIVCSPGVTQAKNLAGEIMGADGLLKILETKKESTPHEMRNEVIFQVQRFVGSNDLPQDVTVVIVDVKDRIIRLAK